MNNRIGWARRSFLSESKTKSLKFQMNLLTESALLIMVLLQVFQKDTKYCSSVPAQNVTKTAQNHVSADNQSFCRAVRWPTGGTLTKAGRLIKCAEPWAPRARARPQCPNVKRQIPNISSLVQHLFQFHTWYVIQSWPTRAHVPKSSLTRSKIGNPGKSPDNTQLPLWSPRYKSLLSKLSPPHHTLQLQSPKKYLKTISPHQSSPILGWTIPVTRVSMGGG